MSNELLASKNVVRREKSRIRVIRGGATSVCGMIGVTEKGPVGVVTTITSWDEFVDIFGGDVANSDAVHSVRGFFEEGGTQLRFVRTVHYTDVDTPATKTSAAASGNLQTGAGAATAGTVLGTVVGPFNLEPGLTLRVDVDGGGVAVATFNATAATRTAGNTETYALSNGQTLTVEIDGGATQTVTFLTAQFVSIGAATAAEVAAVINATLVGASCDVDSGAPRITSDARGTASSVEVTGGTANGALGFNTALTSGTGNVADIDAVTVAEVKTVVEAAVSGCTVTDVGGAVQIESDTTGASSSILVEAASTADDELGLDNATHVGTTGAATTTAVVSGKYDGTYANDLDVVISDASSGEAARFNWQEVDSAGIVLQTFPNLTMDADDARYIEKIVNGINGRRGSTRFSVADSEIAGSALQRRPANGTYSLTGGDDGLTSLADADFIGSSAGGTGLYALDSADDVRLLCVPGRATSAVQNAMITYCEVWRGGSIFALLDPPAGYGATSIVTYVRSTAGLKGLSEIAAIFWPEVRVVNPQPSLYGDTQTIVVPPSGIIAGVMARNDASRPGGIYSQAAGVERGIMRTVLGFAGDAEDGSSVDDCRDVRKRDLVYPELINPLTAGRSGPRFIDGTRTLKDDGDFPTIAESRGVIYISTAVEAGTEFGRHDDNTEELARDLEQAVELFLRGETRNGAFRSKDPTQAFFVDFGAGLNPESVVFLRERRGRIGLATKKPADWIIIGIGQDTRALEQELAEG